LLLAVSAYRSEWNHWLDCLSEQKMADQVGVSQKTVSDWVSEKRKDALFTNPPESRQHGARGKGKKVESPTDDPTPKLSDLGISKNESSLWLDCLSEREIGEKMDVTQPTINAWLIEKKKDPLFYQTPESRQHFGQSQEGSGEGTAEGRQER
jgi:transposase